MSATIAVPETLDNLHPKIRAWISEHKRDQSERAVQRRRRSHDPWHLPPNPRADLTERDSYRFRVTSVLLQALEKGGGKVSRATISGKLVFDIGGETVECVVVEKMCRPIKVPSGEAGQWTAYPEHHQTGLYCTGFLRVEITTYVGQGRQRKWIETPTRKIGDDLREIVSEILATGPILAKLRREREEQQRRYEEERAARHERQRLKEIDDRRWSKFRELARNLEECRRLQAFIDALRSRIEAEGDTVVEDRRLSEWVSWAEQRVQEMNPLSQGAQEVLEAIVRTY